MISLHRVCKKNNTLGVVHELDRGEVHDTQDQNPNADEWKTLNHALRKIAKEAKLEKLLVVRHVGAHVAAESRKQVKDKMKFNTEGNEETHELADASAKLGADMDKTRSAESLASEMQNEPEKVK